MVQVSLFEDEFGWLDLGCDPYVVTQVQIGSPAVREVMRARALASGSVDDTRFWGPRAVTVTMQIKNHDSALACERGESWSDMTLQMDALIKYMNPRRRPFLVYQLPHSTQTRAMEVRGSSWPIQVSSPKYPTFALQFVCPSGEVFDAHTGLNPICLDINPASDIEEGRHYDAPEDQYGPYHTNSTGLVERQYPPGDPIGGRVITNPGTASTHYELTIFGRTRFPTWTINGVTMEFDWNEGVDILGGESLVINTRDRTILYNGEPGQSRYDRSNYNQWNWDQLKLMVGRNTVRFGGETLTATSTARLCYRPSYL